MITCILNPRKSNSRDVITAFARGAMLRGLDPQILTGSASPPAGGSVAFYGVDADTKHLWDLVRSRNQEYWYIDNGYFNSKWKGVSDPYYRITRNAMQHTGKGSSYGARWRDLHIEPKPWRTLTAGKSALVALQSDWWYIRHGTSKQAWLRDVVQEVRGKGIGIEVRDKSEHKKPLEWDRFQSVIAHSSNVLIDGLLEGVPCFALAPCAASAMSGAFPDIGALRYPSDEERQGWASVLADNQWTLEEIGEGMCWETLR